MTGVTQVGVECRFTGHMEPLLVCQHIAKRQGGFIHRTQCRAAGLPDGQLHRLVASKGWQRHLPQVFLLPGSRPSRSALIRAAYMWAGPDSVVGFESAAYLHGLIEHHFCEPRLYAAHGKAAHGVKVHRLHEGKPPASRMLKGMRVTTVARTLLDLCTIWPARRVGEAMDSALRDGLATLDRLESAAASENQRGVRTLRRLVGGRNHLDPAVRSELETRMLKVLKPLGHGLVANHVVHDGARVRYLDFAFPHVRLAIECQGIKWHLGNEAFKEDMRRHRRLTLLGWTVLFYTWDDVVFVPASVRSEVEASIKRLTPTPQRLALD